MRSLSPCLGSILVLLFSSSSLYAQNAQISGALKDQTGGVLPGVTVTAKNVATGLTRSAVSESTAEYRVPALPPGAYSVVAELHGFGTANLPDIVLIIEQDAVINFTLKPAGV